MDGARSAPSRSMERTRYPGIYRRGGRYVVMFRDALGRQHRRSCRMLAEARQVQRS